MKPFGLMVTNIQQNNKSNGGITMKIVKMYLSKEPTGFESIWYDRQQKLYNAMGYKQSAGIFKNQFGMYIILIKH